jgi:hypothetical protein
MAINRTLVWILAGGAALAIGGAAIWWWRRRAKAKLEPTEPDQEGIPTVADPLDVEIHAAPAEKTETKTTRKPPARGPVAAREPATAEAEPPELEKLEPEAGSAEVVEDEPPTVLVPKSRRKRYRVGVGELIELRPDTLPAESAWQPSRPDVAVRVVEQDQERSVVALDGPAGEVNVALQTPDENGKSRTLCSWKFQIVEKAA